MAVKLRLMRMGKTKQPTYRVVVSDSRSPRNGRFIELLGTYEPRLEPSGIKIDAEKTQKWLDNGAQPTERVQKVLEAAGVLVGEDAKRTQAAKKMAKRKIVKGAQAEAAAKQKAAEEAAAKAAAEAEAAEAAAAAEAEGGEEASES